MSPTPEEKRKPDSLEDNLKKAMTELLVLYLLSQQEYYIGELASAIQEKSGGRLNIVFPYAAIYRMGRNEYITESKKRFAPDGRLRQYYTITEEGRAYLDGLLAVYRRFTAGVEELLSSGGEER
ncbi:MAG: PadR family transcriptional regulator [Clostridiales bacterium]|nr:PadR family transcriptional regulator [Clostridiales bacterium]